MPGKPGEPLQEDELGAALQIALHNLDKVGVGDARANLVSFTRGKHSVNGVAIKPPTMTVRIGDEMVKWLKGDPNKARGHLLMIAIPSELIGDYRKKRDSPIVIPA